MADPGSTAGGNRERAVTSYLTDAIVNEHNLHKLKTTSAAAVTTTTTAETNRHSASATSVNAEPSNKKLRLLENLYFDDAHDDAGDSASASADERTSFCILQEVAAYLGPTVLTEEEKMLALLFWKRHCNAYPHLSQVAKVYLTWSSSSVPVESMFSVTGFVKNSRRSSSAPHRLNTLCFVHDNYNKFLLVK